MIPYLLIISGKHKGLGGKELPIYYARVSLFVVRYTSQEHLSLFFTHKKMDEIAMAGLK